MEKRLRWHFYSSFVTYFLYLHASIITLPATSLGTFSRKNNAGSNVSLSYLTWRNNSWFIGRKYPYSTDYCCYISAILRQYCWFIFVIVLIIVVIVLIIVVTISLTISETIPIPLLLHCSNIAMLLIYRAKVPVQHRLLLLHCSNIAMLLQYCCNVTIVCAVWILLPYKSATLQYYCNVTIVCAVWVLSPYKSATLQYCYNVTTMVWV